MNQIAGNKKSAFDVTSGRKLYPFFNIVNKKLCAINQRSPQENFKKSILIYIVLVLLGAVYFLTAILLFHTLWYHILFSILSTVIFIYLCYEYYFERLSRRLKADFPKCCRKLAHYIAHYKGNVIHALKDTEEKGPESTRLYMAKIRKAFEAVDMENSINEVKTAIPYTWIKMLCTLLIFGKQSGNTDTVFGEHLSEENSCKVSKNQLEKNVRRITNVLSQINIEQGYNDADLQGIELFMFFSPYLIIIATEIFNSQILIEMSMPEVYGSIEAQTIKALMFLLGNISALFIHWMRKQQN